MYETLPVIFSRMGPVIPVVFFLAVLIAALTSSISMYEVVVAWLVDEKKFSRMKAVVTVFVSALVLGSLCALLPKVFSACDFATSNIFMTLGAFVFTVVVGWKMPKKVAAETFGSRIYPFVHFLVKWVAPVAIAVIAVTNLL